MRILVVEDNPDIAKVIIAGFEHESFAVDHTDDGEKGSYMARTNDYDVIILDLMLPHKDGYTICKEIREIGKNTPIIMLSVHAATQSKIDILNDGADDYMAKPFSIDELIARVRALLRRPRSVEPVVYEIGDMIMNTKTQKVLRGDDFINLTRKEFAILEFLARNKGLVVSRQDIHEHVWNNEGNPLSNTVEAHILNLRKKLCANGHKPLIHTISGRGYKLDTQE